ncbi:hypothetical protein [Brevundimonas sp.]|uniref:hypothetical protein n=1 Tax=Brevundimonas sp. TaxID=1871086 RepID=UPI0035B1E442
MPRPRPPRPDRRQFLRAMQLHRLEGVAAGTCEPMSAREELYLRFVDEGLSPDIEEFVVSEPLLLLERTLQAEGTWVERDPADGS